MALIKCPECSRDVSDRSLECPSCGNPINSGGNRQLNIIPTSVMQKELAIINTLKNQDLSNPNVARNILQTYNNGSYKFQSQTGLDFIDNLNRIAGNNHITINNYYASDIQNDYPVYKKIHTPSLVLSIIGLASIWIFIWIGLICSIIGLVIAVKNRHEYSTTAALVVSIIALGIFVLFLLLAFMIGISIGMMYL